MPKFILTFSVVSTVGGLVLQLQAYSCTRLAEGVRDMVTLKRVENIERGGEALIDRSPSYFPI